MPKRDMGAPARPDPIQSRRAGLRGKDQQQDALQDVSSNIGETVSGALAETQRSPHQDMQSLPEGLRRERKGPYDKNIGRNEPATQVPKNWIPKGGA
jgi:hypothetical protein